jgi:hypothetical protein
VGILSFLHKRNLHGGQLSIEANTELCPLKSWESCWIAVAIYNVLVSCLLVMR